jgi:hypothetical protein
MTRQYERLNQFADNVLAVCGASAIPANQDLAARPTAFANRVDGAHNGRPQRFKRRVPRNHKLNGFDGRFQYYDSFSD